MANAGHPLVRHLARAISQLGHDAALVFFARKKAVRYTSAGVKIRGAIYHPKSDSPSPGVLLLHTALGLTVHERAMAARLAQAGYATLVIPYSKRTTGLVIRDDYQRSRLEQIVTDGLRVLQEQPCVLADRTAVIGLSLGGYFTRRLASGAREITPRAVIIYYGMYALPESEAARLASPLLALQGEDDSADFIANAKKAEELASRYGHSVELVLYPGAVHQFDVFQPGSTATRDAWNRTLAFLSQHLAG